MATAMMLGLGMGLAGGATLGNFVFQAKDPKSYRHFSQEADHDDEVKPDVDGVVPAALREVHEYMPHWAHQPDFERVAWLNNMVSILWPHLSLAIKRDVMAQAEPQIALAIKDIAMVEEVVIEHLDLGSNPPSLGGVKAHQTKEDECIIETPLNMGSNAAVRVSVRLRLGPVSMYVPAEVRNLAVKGLARITFRPLRDELPCLGAVTVSLMDVPEVDVSLSLINSVDLMAFPGAREAVNAVVAQVLHGMLVHPNAMSFPIMPNYGVQEPPAGMLIVTVVKVSGLKGGGDLLSKPDPYMVVEVREGRAQRTAVQSNTRNPEFNEQFKFLVDDTAADSVTLTIKETDSFSDPSLGFGVVGLDPAVCEATRVPNTRVDMEVELHKSPNTGGVLGAVGGGAVKGVKSIKKLATFKGGSHKKEKAVAEAVAEGDTPIVGTCFINLQFVPIFHTEEESDEEEEPAAKVEKPVKTLNQRLARRVGGRIRADNKGVATIKLERCFNLKGEPDAFVEFSVRDPDAEEEKLRTQESTTVDHDSNPRWGSKFDFVHISATSIITAKVYDRDSLTRNDFLGEVRIPVATLARNSRMKDIYPLEGEDVQQGEIALSMEWYPIEAAS